MSEVTVARKPGISGSTLKLIAIFTMLIDHIGAVILEPMMLQGHGYAGLISYDPVLYEVDMFLRLVIGRMAFPIFCFLLVEGFQRTTNVYRYGGRLLFFAMISEFTFDLALNDMVLESSYQNVMFTLFVGLLVMFLSRRLDELRLNRLVTAGAYLVILVLGMLLAEGLQTDYGAYGVLCIAALYHFRKERKIQLLAGTVAFWAGDYFLNGSMNELLAPLGFIAVACYNGERGLRLKYLFYAFYPVHLLVLYGIRLLLV